MKEESYPSDQEFPSEGSEVIRVSDLLDILSDVRADDEQVWEAIYAQLEAPEPDPSDPEAVKEYAELMGMAKYVARQLVERSARTLEIQERLRDLGVDIPGLGPND